MEGKQEEVAAVDAAAAPAETEQNQVDSTAATPDENDENSGQATAAPADAADVTAAPADAALCASEAVPCSMKDCSATKRSRRVRTQ